VSKFLFVHVEQDYKYIENYEFETAINIRVVCLSQQVSSNIQLERE